MSTTHTVLLEVIPLMGVNDKPETISIPLDKMCFVQAAMTESRNVSLGSQETLEDFITSFEDAYLQLDHHLWELSHLVMRPAEKRAKIAGTHVIFDLCLTDTMFQYTFSLVNPNRIGKHAKL